MLQFYQKFIQLFIFHYFQYIINDWLLPNISHYRQRYGSLVNMCLNYRLQSTHNLSVYSEIEHCTSSVTVDRESGLISSHWIKWINFDDLNATRIVTDFWDALFGAVVALLAALAIGSSIYDCKLAKQDDHNHYRTPYHNRGESLLMFWGNS